MIRKSVEEGLHFALSKKRLLPLFLLNTAFVYLLMFVFLSQFSFAALILMAVIAVVFIIIMIPITAAIIHQALNYPREGTFMKSFEFGKKFFFKLVIANILLGLLSSAVSIIPFVSFIVSILVTLMFLFVQQSIVIDKSRVIQSFTKSLNIFQKFPGQVFLTWLVVILISSFVMLVALIPVGVAFISYIVLPLTPPSVTSAGVVVPQIPTMNFFNKMIEFAKSPIIYVLVLFVTLAMAFVTAFSLGALTRFFIAVKKTRKVK